MSAVNWTKLSKMMSHALRHEPWIYELELDDESWVPVDDLISRVGPGVPAAMGCWLDVLELDFHDIDKTVRE